MSHLISGAATRILHKYKQTTLQMEAAFILPLAVVEQCTWNNKKNDAKFGRQINVSSIHLNSNIIFKFRVFLPFCSRTRKTRSMQASNNSCFFFLHVWRLSQFAMWRWLFAVFAFCLYCPSYTCADNFVENLCVSHKFIDTLLTQMANFSCFCGMRRNICVWDCENQTHHHYSF